MVVRLFVNVSVYRLDKICICVYVRFFAMVVAFSSLIPVCRLDGTCMCDCEKLCSSQELLHFLSSINGLPSVAAKNFYTFLSSINWLPLLFPVFFVVLACRRHLTFKSSGRFLN